MTAADELRQAAATLRERAEATGGSGDTWFDGDEDLRGALRSAYGSYDAGRTDAHADAAFIAVMHPGVGLALADLLEEVAGWRDEGLGLMPEGNVGDAWLSVERQVKVIARLINGDPSTAPTDSPRRCLRTDAPGVSTPHDEPELPLEFPQEGS